MISAVACLMAPAVVMGQDEQPARGLGDLDEMLGLEPEAGDDRSDAGAQAGALDEIEGKLDRALDGQAVAEAFADAVALMGDSATRIAGRGDVGIDTQRLQAEAIRKLEVLIENAQQQQGQQGQQQQQQQQQQQSNQPNQQQQQQQSQQGESQEEMMPPGAQTGQLTEAQAADLTRWGSLPARLREALLQGADEQFSTLYRGMTERYFERLAEEAE